MQKAGVYLMYAMRQYVSPYCPIKTINQLAFSPAQLVPKQYGCDSTS